MYLHTDREFYFTGDTIWFAAYLVDGEFHVPVQENSNLYVELVGEDGKIANREIFMLINGIGQGYIWLNRNFLAEGNYLLRAYNSFLLNFDDDLIFNKRIKIAETKNTFGFPNQSEYGMDTSKTQVNFFPEGGFMLASRINQVAFKIADSEGKGKNTNGKLFDDKGNLIAMLSTQYNGLGKFLFIPERNRNYYVEFDEFPQKKWELPDVRESGAKIMVSKIDSNYLNVNIIKSDDYETDKLFIAMMHRGTGLVYIEIDGKNMAKTLKLNADYFRDGINRIILLSRDNEPLSERLVYMNKSETINLSIELNNQKFATREKVVVKISTVENLITEENAGLSMAVVNNNALNAEGNKQNIRTYLLMDSELKGRIDNPADYYVDQGKLTSMAKLDLLMLTQGWSNYIWNDLENTDIVTEIADLGFSFQGTMSNLSGRKAIENSEVVLGLDAGSQSRLFFTNSDENGNFGFDNIVFSDSAMFFLHGTNSKGKPNTSLTIKPITSASPDINYEQLSDLKNFADIPESVYRLNYFNKMALKEYFPARGSKLLDEIKVKGAKPNEEDGHFRLYSAPSASFKLKDTDFQYSNVFQYLQGRVAGVTVAGTDIIIRGHASLTGSSEPLFLIDGMPTDKDGILAVSMSDVDKIEVLKGNDAAIFGMRGANGAISVFTKKGTSYVPDARDIPGTIIERIKGFAPYREFYSPDYSDKKLSSEVPDYRTTLYWNPEIIVENGEAEVSFFTCDNFSEYTIFIEGITGKGKVCLGSAGFVVETRSDTQ